MIFTREEHMRFLEEELRAQTEAYKQKLDTSALFLLQDREELFAAQFLNFEGLPAVDASSPCLPFLGRMSSVSFPPAG